VFGPVFESLIGPHDDVTVDILTASATLLQHLPTAAHWLQRTSYYTHTHTHTHPVNGPLSGTTRVSRYQKGKTNLDFTEARDSEWQWHQLGHVQVCTLLQTDNHASTPPLSFLQAGCPSCRPTNSVKALKANNDYMLHKSTIDICCCFIVCSCLQCFDGVGWAAGRVSDL